jgi:adenylate kinase
MRVTMLGPPGSGKGTQGAVLADRLGVPHVVSSDLLREHAERSAGVDPAGAQMERGDLVDDQEVIDVVLQRLAEPDTAGGFVLDGFPRSIAQAAALDDWLQHRGVRLDAALLLDVPRHVLIERLASRAASEGRADDNPDTWEHRLDVYDTEAAPLIEFYESRDQLLRVDGDGSEGDVAARVQDALDQLVSADNAPT